MMRFWALTALWFGLALFAGEQIQLHHYRIDVSSNQVTPRPPAALLNASASSRYRLIHLSEPMNPRVRAALVDAGVEPVSYLPQNAFVVRLKAPNADMPDLAFVDWVGFWQPAFKMHPTLGDPRYDAVFNRSRGFTPTLFLHPGAALDPTRDLVLRLGGQILAEADAGRVQRIVARFADDLVASRLAAGDDVAWMVEQGPRELRNDRSRWLVQSQSDPNVVTMATPVYDAGIHGEGQVIGIIDGQIDVASCFFMDGVPPGPDHRKLIYAETSAAPHPHGTHVAGSAVGADIGGSLDGAGIAYQAKAAFSILPANNSGLFFNLLETHALNGAFVHTNSWGTTTSDPTAMDYTVDCADADAFAWQNEQHLVIFATFNDFSFPLAPILSPENAVNVLAVSATESSLSVPSFAVERHGSGTMGPVPLDGRRKPEITAPGVATWSARSSQACAVIQSQGTSMAAPVVAGSAALVRQYFRDGYYPTGTARAANSFIPSGALIKATLLNGAQNMVEDFWNTKIFQLEDTPIPNNIEGWGRVHLDNALYFPGDCARLLIEDISNDQGLSTGDDHTIEFFVSGATPALDITMAFTAPPGTPGAATPVINDLNLLVIAPDGTAYFGNQFENGVSVPGGAFDPLNNVERVRVAPAEPGTWRVQVLAAAVNQDRQGFALAITGDTHTAAPGALDAGANQLYCGSPVTLGVTLGGQELCQATMGLNWTPATGLSDPSAPQPTASPKTTTTYTVTFTLGETILSDTVTVHVETADLNNDAQITLEDVRLFAHMFWPQASTVGDGDPDFNGDGKLDILDLVPMTTCF